MKCPGCNSNLVKFIDSLGLFVCFECDYQFKTDDENASDAPKYPSRHVFLSYGHNKFTALAMKIKSDLEARGHQVWIDHELKAGDDWENKIEQALQSIIEKKPNSCMVLLMCPHAIRKPDGYCLNELAVAVSNNLLTFPVKLTDISPPLSIARIQWIDMIDCAGLDFSVTASSYEEKKKLLLDAIENDQIDFEGTLSRLLHYLKPIHFSAEVERYTKGFVGREWLLNDIRAWLENTNATRVFWITGGPGVGKTAISLWLSCIQLTEISSWHLCQHSNSITSDPRRCVMSLAYFLSTHLPDYKEVLIHLDLEDITNNQNTAAIFQQLLINPLRQLKKREKPIVILIDALDEASHENGNNELARFIGANFSLLPDWVRLLVTSRPVNEVTKWFKQLKPYFIDAGDPRNNNDVALYVEKRLSGFNMADKQNAKSAILDRSAGVFLYAEFVCNAILNGELNINDIDKYPVGLESVYEQYFSRRFKDLTDFRRRIAPLLRIIAASYAPIPMPQLYSLLEKHYSWTEEDWVQIAKDLGAIFVFRDESIIPFHKSIIDWLTADSDSDYFVSKLDGHKKISEWGIGCCKDVELNELPEYLKNYIALHLIKSKQYQLCADLLSNQDLFDARQKSFGFDTSLQLFFRDLKELHCLSENKTSQVFSSTHFLQLVSENRRYFMDHGFFFDMHEMGYGDLLDTKSISKKTIKEQTAILYFFYAKEEFRKVIDIVEDTLTGYDKNQTFETCQISEVYGLSLRKIGDFCKAQGAFRNTIAIAESINDDYQMSIGLMNIAKINYHLTDFKSAYKHNSDGIIALEKALNKQIKDRSRLIVSTQLFLAEYHRLAAETCIWNNDFQKANKMLDKTLEIYKEVNTRDRYFVRFLYTSAQCRIMEHKMDDAHILLLESKKHMRNHYDQATINYFHALWYLFSAAIKNDDRMFAAASDYAGKALKLFNKIEAALEILEVNILLSILKVIKGESRKKLVLGEFLGHYIWANHVFRYFVNQLKTITKNERISHLGKWWVDSDSEKTNLLLSL